MWSTFELLLFLFALWIMIKEDLEEYRYPFEEELSFLYLCLTCSYTGREADLIYFSWQEEFQRSSSLRWGKGEYWDDPKTGVRGSLAGFLKLWKTTSIKKQHDFLNIASRSSWWLELLLWAETHGFIVSKKKCEVSRRKGKDLFWSPFCSNVYLFKDSKYRVISKRQQAFCEEWKSLRSEHRRHLLKVASKYQGGKGLTYLLLWLGENGLYMKSSNLERGQILTGEGDVIIKDIRVIRSTGFKFRPVLPEGVRGVNFIDHLESLSLTRRLDYLQALSRWKLFPQFILWIGEQGYYLSFSRFKTAEIFRGKPLFWTLVVKALIGALDL